MFSKTNIVWTLVEEDEPTYHISLPQKLTFSSLRLVELHLTSGGSLTPKHGIGHIQNYMDYCCAFMSNMTSRLMMVISHLTHLA